MIKTTITVILSAALDIAAVMSRSGERAVFAPSDFAARCWERISSTGKTLETIVDRVATWCDIDISTYMIDRAYGL